MRKVVLAVLALLALLFIYVAVCAFASRKAVEKLSEFFPAFEADKVYYFPVFDVYAIQGMDFHHVRAKKLIFKGLKKGDSAEFEAKRVEIEELISYSSGAKKITLKELRFEDDSFIFADFAAEDLYYKGTRFSKIRISLVNTFENVLVEGSGGFNGLYGAFKLELTNSDELSKIDMRLAFDKFNFSATGYVLSDKELEKALFKLLSLHGLGFDALSFISITGFNMSYEDFGLWLFLGGDAPEGLKAIDTVEIRWDAKESGFPYGLQAVVLASVFENQCIDGVDSLFFRATVNDGVEKRVQVPSCLTEHLGESGEGLPYVIIPPIDEGLEDEEEWLVTPFYEE